MNNVPDDPIHTTVIRKARFRTVKDGIEQIIHYETDVDSIVDLKQKLNGIITSQIDKDAITQAIIDDINNGGHLDLHLERYALLDSPVFINQPKAPTPAVTDNSTRLATTAFVKTYVPTAIDAKLIDYQTNIVNNTALTGTPTAPTAAVGTSTTQIATTEFVHNQITANLNDYAKLNSPVFTGTPKAPTAAATSNDTTIATTAFVKHALDNAHISLTFDNTPIGGSVNPVTSDGIFKAIKAAKDSFATVATTGSYNDLINKPGTATSSAEGFVKIYNSVGTNADGTMTQLSISNALDQKMDKATLATVATTGKFTDLNDIPTATDTIKGITKLYSNTGSHSDGAISQAAFTAAMDNYLKLSGGKMTGIVDMDTYNIEMLSNSTTGIKWYKMVGGNKTYEGQLTPENYTGTAAKAIADKNGNAIDTYYATKAELSVIPKFQILIVNALPTTDISKTTIYLVKDPSGHEGDLFKEYIYTSEDKWELISSPKINLDGYVLKAELDSKLLLKADLNSPMFTGTPSAPTASIDTYTDQLATTKWVTDKIGSHKVTQITEPGDDSLQESIKMHQLWVDITGDSDIP